MQIAQLGLTDSEKQIINTLFSQPIMPTFPT